MESGDEQGANKHEINIAKDTTGMSDTYRARLTTRDCSQEIATSRKQV